MLQILIVRKKKEIKNINAKTQNNNQQIKTIDIGFEICIANSSNILNKNQLTQIIAHCHSRFHLMTWRLKYSNSTHGSSMHTFYEKCLNVENSILIIMDSKRNVFGAFIADAKWDPKIDTYRGSMDCFVYKFLENNQIQTYRSSGLKNYFLRNEFSRITIGAAESPALYFDADFNKGHSANCPTFNNDFLSNDKWFDILELEVWAPYFE